MLLCELFLLKVSDDVFTDEKITCFACKQQFGTCLNSAHVLHSARCAVTAHLSFYSWICKESPALCVCAHMRACVCMRVQVYPKYTQLPVPYHGFLSLLSALQNIDYIFRWYCLQGLLQGVVPFAV